MGRMTSTLSLTRLQKYSLFQKYSARSATCRVVRCEYVRRLRKSNHLEVWASHRLGELAEQGLLDLCKFGRVHDFENVFNLVQEHDFLGAVDLGPVAQETKHDFLGQGGIFLQELNNTVCKLWVVHAKTLHFVQGDENARQEELVFLLQRQGETVDNGAEYFEQLGNSVKALRLVDELEKDVVDGASDEGSQVQEFAVDAVEGRLEEVALAGVFRVKQVEQRQDKAVVDILLGVVCVEIRTFYETEEELVNYLDVRPGDFKNRLVLLWVECVALGVHWRRNGTEQVLAEHLDDSGVHGLGYDLAVLGDVIEQLVQSEALDLLGLHVCAGVVEVENDVALVELLHEELLAPIRGDFVEAGQLLQLALSLI